MDRYIVISHTVQLIYSWGLILLGMISIIVALYFLCGRKPDFDDVLTPEEWQQALAERMEMTLRANRRLGRAWRQGQEQGCLQRPKREFGDAGTSFWERKSGLEKKYKEITGDFEAKQPKIFKVRFADQADQAPTSL